MKYGSKKYDDVLSVDVLRFKALDLYVFVAAPIIVSVINDRDIMTVFDSTAGENRRLYEV